MSDEQEDVNNELTNQIQRLRETLDHIDDYIFTKDIQGRYTYANQKVLDLFGSSIEEVIGSDDSKFFSLEESDDIKINDQLVMFEGQAIDKEERNVIVETGETRYYRSEKKPLKDSDGTIIGMFGIATDITNTKRTQSKLKVILDEQSVILNNQLVGVVTLRDRCILWANSAFEILLGYDEGELIGAQTRQCYVSDEDYQEIGMAYKDIEDGGVVRNEIEFVRKDGEIIWVSLRGAALHDNSADSIWVFVDVTERKQVENELRLSESRLRTVANLSYDIIWQWDIINDDHQWFGDIDTCLGYEPNKFPRTIEAWEGVIHPDDHERVINSLDRHHSEHTEWKEEYRVIKKDGTIRYWDDRGKTIWDGDGKPISMTGAIMDITERKQAEEKLKLSSRVFTETNEGITITDADMNIIDINPAFSEITGYSREDIIGQNPRILSSGKQSSEFYQEMWQDIHEQGHWQGEVWNRKKDGEIYAELLNIFVLKDDNGSVVNYVGLFTDITNSKRQQEQLSLMAHYDVLTGLPNRALFTDRFTQAIAHSKRTESILAVCFLDLDNFKPVNDNYGHEVGDRLLIEVAQRITANIREEDTVSRQGGDEFALLLNDIDSYAQCKHSIDRILHSLAVPYIIDDHSYKITASVGITLYPEDDEDIDTLLRHADQSMYQAKLEGKHRHHLFNPQRDQLVVMKHHQLDEIEQALANNELQLYYQPKVNMVSGEVFGAEALIRWIHPEKGLIPPLDFLPTIDGTELETKVGNWVINEALSQLEAWWKQGLRLEVSVNISSHHLLSETFFSELDVALANYPSVDSQCLQLEILESSALGDLDTITSVIEACQGALGIKVALDDFGTGYSSLTHLRSLPVDTIKIDQSFVRDLLDDPGDYAIIDGIIGLSSSFNREVIAEGVETTNHGLMLLIMGCEEAQGYGIAKPIPAEDFPQWLKDYIPNKEWQLCGNKHRSTRENKIKLFRLVINQWKDTFIKNIQSPPDRVEHWPIMNNKHCSCGTWINRARQEQLFEESSLQQLDDAHEKLHLIAHSLHIQYQEGDLNTAREDLPEMKDAFDNLQLVLGMCE